MTSAKEAAAAARAEEFKDYLASRELPPAVPLAPFRISADRFGQDGQYWQTHQVLVPESTDIEEMLKPDFWQHFANRIRTGDFIEVRSDFLSLYAKLEVTNSDPVRSFVEVRLREPINRLDRTDPCQEEDRQYSIDYGGKAIGWTITRRADGHVVAKDFQSRHDALHHVRTSLSVRRLS